MRIIPIVVFNYSSGRAVTLSTSLGLKIACALLDSGAQVNLVNQRWAIQHDLLINSTPQKVEAISRHWVLVYRQVNTLVYTTDSKGKKKLLTQTIDTVDMKDYNVILGTP